MFASTQAKTKEITYAEKQITQAHPLTPVITRAPPTSRYRAQRAKPPNDNSSEKDSAHTKTASEQAPASAASISCSVVPPSNLSDMPEIFPRDSSGDKICRTTALAGGCAGK